MITIDQEIVRIWTGPWNGGKILFLLNRYGSEAALLLVAVFGNFTESTANKTVRMDLGWMWIAAGWF